MWALYDLQLTFAHSQTDQSLSVLLRRSLVIDVEVFLVPDSAKGVIRFVFTEGTNLGYVTYKNA
jgi:hypothetical protein